MADNNNNNNNNNNHNNNHATTYIFIHTVIIMEIAIYVLINCL